MGTAGEAGLGLFLRTSKRGASEGPTGASGLRTGGGRCRRCSAACSRGDPALHAPCWVRAGTSEEEVACSWGRGIHSVVSRLVRKTPRKTVFCAQPTWPWGHLGSGFSREGLE